MSNETQRKFVEMFPGRERLRNDFMVLGKECGRIDKLNIWQVFEVYEVEAISREQLRR